MNGFQVAWFWLIGVLLTGYIILDGFDLGVGFWYLFAGKQHRRRLLSSILPYWDGNEVWLLTGGGAVFAAFPHVYATVFSGFYLALMLVLFALIFRAVSIEFRNQLDSDKWKYGWDVAFAVGSIIPALLLGVAMGNILRGLPLDSSMDYTGTFFTLLNPYALLFGVAGLAMFATHGAVFVTLKTDGELAARATRWGHVAWAFYLALFVGVFTATATTEPQLLANFVSRPALWALPVLALAGILAIGHFNNHGAALTAFLASAASMVLLMATLGVAIFPKMVPALNDPALSLTIMNASSSPLTLKTMLILAVIGVPVVLAYTVWVHSMFRGKASEKTSY